MRRPLAKVRKKAFLPLCLRTQFQNLLLPQQIKGQGSGDRISQLFGGDLLKIPREFGKEKRMASFVGFNQALLPGGIGQGILVFQVIDLPFEQWVVAKKIENAE